MFFKNLSLAGALLFYLGMRKEMAALKVARNKVKSS